MNVKLVVFDLAGTTVKDDRNVHKVLQKALAKHGVTVSLEDCNDVMGLPKPIAIRDLLERRYEGSRPVTAAWINEIHKRFVEEMILFYKTDPSVGEKEGVSDTFRKLKAHNMKVVVDTGFDRQITDPLLERLGWKSEALIDGSVTSDEVERGRPYPDLIFRAMELTNVNDASQVVKVGDTISDVHEGQAAGCGMVVGVTTGAFSREVLSEAKPTHLIEQLPQLLDILEI
ncbi:HAD hydrolase-like protein [Chryseolinea sp. T2]|uniref:HAD hydrolase-like protein n=1 Tax=Chryseolinea sp. T2 TaxID=3129255 RepID=UPI00307749D7